MCSGCAMVETYDMRSEISSAKMGHAIQTSEGGTPTLAVMSVELLLSKDISTSLQYVPQRSAGALMKDKSNKG